MKCWDDKDQNLWAERLWRRKFAPCSSFRSGPTLQKLMGGTNHKVPASHSGWRCFPRREHGRDPFQWRWMRECRTRKLLRVGSQGKRRKTTYSSSLPLPLLFLFVSHVFQNDFIEGLVGSEKLLILYLYSILSSKHIQDCGLAHSKIDFQSSLAIQIWMREYKFLKKILTNWWIYLEKKRSKKKR